MANDIQLKRSSVTGKTPDAANVLVGEPVVNLTDKILYTKDGTGNVIVIGAGITSNITEGTNLYFTNARVVSALTAGQNITLDANGRINSTATGGGILTTANVTELTNLYFTNARVQANVTNYLSTGLVSVGNIALSTVYDVNSRRGNVGQILTSMSGNTVQWTNKFFSSVDPPDFNTINYGDIWYYITENKPYMWITDGTDDYFYDFLPPTF